MAADPLRCERPVFSSQEKLKGMRVCWFLLPVVIFLLMVTCVFPFTIDDAYISLRYAENWANGYGPVFNPGERVEGYTNFLLVVIEMLLFKLGLEGLLPVKIFSILCEHSWALWSSSRGRGTSQSSWRPGVFPGKNKLTSSRTPT
jgi:hypothetical protein